MAEQETTRTISLKRELMKTPRYKRAKKAISAVRQLIGRYEKSPEVKIGRHLNLKIWEHGIKNVPAKIKVTITKSDKNVATAELFGAPKEEPKAEKKDKAKSEEAKGIESAVEDKAQETAAKETKKSSANEKPKANSKA